MRKLGGFEAWVRRTPWMPLGLLAVIAGTATLAFAPFFGTEIPIGTATVSASFLGAFAAVLGGAWLARARQKERDHETALAIRLLAEGYPVEIDAFLEIGTRPIDDRETQREFMTERLRLLDLATSSRDDVEALLAHVGDFGAVNIVGLLELKRGLKRLAETLDSMPRSDPSSILGGRHAMIEKANSEISRSLEALRQI